MSLSVFSLSMYTLSGERERIAAILGGTIICDSGQLDEVAEHQRRHSLQSESEKEALQLKQDGNDHFRRKNFFTAIQKYTLAIMRAPWPSHAERRKVLDECLTSLQLCSPGKYRVARKLLHYSTSESPHCSRQDALEKRPTLKSPLLASCFGNRSAALYELGRIEECLSDIELAILHGYVVSSPEDKLMKRREKCLAQLQKRNGKTKQRPSSINEAKDRRSNLKLCNAFESEHVTIKSCEGSGRYIEAVRDLQPEDIVFSEEPYAAVLDKQFVHTHCSFCFVESLTLIPCCHCSSEGYCCSECRREAWKRYHWLECPVADMWKKVDWMMRLCLRIVVRADTEEILSAITRQDVHSDNQTHGVGYSAIYSLVAHKDKFTDDSQKLALEKMSDNLLQCFGDTILSYLQVEHSCSPEGSSKASTDQNVSETVLVQSECQDSLSGNQDEEKHHDSTTVGIGKYDASGTNLRMGLRQLFYHHLCQLRCNSHFVSAVMSDRTQESADTAASTAATHETVETTSERKLGSVIYPTASLMNHSCAPNAIFRFTGNVVKVCVTENVKAGHEINNSYGPQIGRMKRSDRQRILRNKYFFECNCSACSRSSPNFTLSEVVLDALLCPKCMTGPLESDKSADTQAEIYHCLQCHSFTSSELLSKSIQKRTEARKMFQEVTAGDKMSIHQLLSCLKEQSKVLHRHNLELARTNDALAQAYAVQGDFQSAVPYCRKSCEAVGMVYGSNSVEVANEKEKLSQLLFHSGCYDSALRTAHEAHELLQIYRGEEDQSCQELEEMIKLLSSKNY